MCLLLARVEHGGDEQEAGRDCALADTEEDSAREEPAEVVCSGVAELRYGPNEDVDTEICRDKHGDLTICAYMLTSCRFLALELQCHPVLHDVAEGQPR